MAPAFINNGSTHFMPAESWLLFSKVPPITPCFLGFLGDELLEVPANLERGGYSVMPVFCVPCLTYTVTACFTAVFGTGWKF